MKRIMKDHESITKDYENFFYSMKDECEKFFNIKSQVTHSNSPVLTESLLRHLNFLKKSPTFRILFRKSPAFTSALKLGFHLALTRVNSSYFFLELIFKFKVNLSRY